MLSIKDLPDEINHLIEDYWLPRGYKKMKDIIHELPKSGSIAMKISLEKRPFYRDGVTGVTPSARALWKSDLWVYWILDGQWRRDNGRYSFFQSYSLY